MSRVELIICERTSRWAAALRMALAAEERCRLRETRRLTELETELAERANCVAAIEVRRDNFAEVLEWLPRVRAWFTSARFVALVDRSLAEDWGAASDVFAEDGVDAVVASPRRVGAVIKLVRHQAKMRAIVDENEPIAARVWASLPWQRR